ncbi:MAG: tRNA (adenosine(37)-N6)-threonylcarbamoyltransferase complex transferase subunit TsaD [FCB group bacterium]|nr:tRNA (adenosine(37)-N6)-threonylcarbamoyltransferase complex transferase subunit TsaD [FCB group bacterium]
MAGFIAAQCGIGGNEGSPLIVLGIETSCDETAAAVCRDGNILSSIISSQEIHKAFGGVVPELASREHERLLNELVGKALQDAGVALTDLQGIAVTHGPGLAGTLLTGVCFSKGLSQGLGIPFIAINHLEAHIFANFLADPTLEYPFICLLVSGGHTQLWQVDGLGKYRLLGETRDDAAGEAFDKGARILGLGYPGGPEIEKRAKNGNPEAVQFPRSFLNSDTMEFSFSGLKTSLLYYMDRFAGEVSEQALADVAASYQAAIIDVLTEKLSLALERTNIRSAVIAGGVAANRALRRKIAKRLPDKKVVFPDLIHCTDNAAMVAYLGEMKLNDGQVSPLDIDIVPNLKLS